MQALSKEYPSETLKRKIDPTEPVSSTKKKQNGSKTKKEELALVNPFQDLEKGFSNNQQQESFTQFPSTPPDETNLFFSLVNPFQDLENGFFNNQQQEPLTQFPSTPPDEFFSE